MKNILNAEKITSQKFFNEENSRVLILIDSDLVWKSVELIESDNKFFEAMDNGCNRIKTNFMAFFEQNPKKIIGSGVVLTLFGIIFCNPDFVHASELKFKIQKKNEIENFLSHKELFRMIDVLNQNEDWYKFHKIEGREQRIIFPKKFLNNDLLENNLIIDQLAKIVFNRTVINQLFDNIFHRNHNIIPRIPMNSFLHMNIKKKLILSNVFKIQTTNTQILEIGKTLFTKSYLATAFLILIYSSQILFNFAKRKNLLQKLVQKIGGKAKFTHIDEIFNENQKESETHTFSIFMGEFFLIIVIRIIWIIVDILENELV
jgi:hypothetical protein